MEAYGEERAIGAGGQPTTPASTLAAYAREFKRALSVERLRQYDPAGDDLDMITNYLWNVALCQALYPSLGALEVALRNTIHDTLTNRFNTAWWIDLPTLLERREEQQVVRAIVEIARRRKPVTPGRVVAELNFGFWTSILDRAYGTSLWAPSNPAVLIQQAFPHAPRHFQVRGRVHDRFNTIRRLRNRVFHHEPIWHWTDLGVRHADLIDAIGWINPTLQATILASDSFDRVFRIGKADIEREVKQRLNIT